MILHGATDRIQGLFPWWTSFVWIAVALGIIFLADYLVHRD